MVVRADLYHSGFAGNTDLELCSRWMQLSAFFPFYRNHNVFASISQEAYVWSDVAEATRTVMNIRYQLLPYIYTLFHYATTQGTTVMRALPWEFPDEENLKGVETQFLLGPALLITPVLEPLVSHVKGVFPGIASGAIWYDWYTYAPVKAKAGQNVTLAAPLGHINVHVLGGNIIPLQGAGNNTAESRKKPWTLFIALDKNAAATGSLYLDDGESLVQKQSLTATFTYSEGVLQYTKTGTYPDTNSLGGVTVIGMKAKPSEVLMGGVKLSGSCWSYSKGVLKIQDLSQYFSEGVWHADWVMTVA